MGQMGVQKRLYLLHDAKLEVTKAAVIVNMEVLLES